MAGIPRGSGMWTTACCAGGRCFVAGERRLDLAVRLEADEVAFRLVARVDDAVDQVAVGGDLDVIANYTAFQQIRATFGRTT